MVVVIVGLIAFCLFVSLKEISCLLSLLLLVYVCSMWLVLLLLLLLLFLGVVVDV